MIILFRLIAFLEGLSYLLLLFVASPLKHFYDDPYYVKLLGMPHGILFIGYLILAYLIKKRMQWHKNVFLIVLLSSIIPFGTFYVEYKYVNRK